MMFPSTKTELDVCRSGRCVNLGWSEGAIVAPITHPAVRATPQARSSPQMRHYEDNTMAPMTQKATKAKPANSQNELSSLILATTR